jgi:hypothetical protein
MSGEKNIKTSTATTSSQMSRSSHRLSRMHFSFREHDVDSPMLPTMRRVAPSTRVCMSAVCARGA